MDTGFRRYDEEVGTAVGMEWGQPDCEKDFWFRTPDDLRHG
jgi:hypothetical protein